MINLQKEYIQQCFEYYAFITSGVWFSGIEGEGEYVKWKIKGKINSKKGIKIHYYSKNNKADGEYKSWLFNEKGLEKHFWYENDKIMVDFLEHPELKKQYKLKDGYILGGDGRYYRD